ncbi:cell division protein ZipA C-terminal FtsZ-binding domain-containing protein [Ramlibacter sp. WS9]|uniref:cell division protein ZipA C-terminal FtsZ-binding domain-containing protein n=1 Tax=Ramlibacter sp. WS9 TaxID=1882741 RepID=UPI0011436788|nr:cell division protein ZipA C-terminal FtsZ-binding domain-containing protein [Ramlibacter sp. WS9]ROZ68572.1 cell division protein FtsZ [Ramlibacter sp. WS9]
MSGFTVGLAILGGLVLAALVAWNAWTTRRNTPRQPDAVVPTERIEPTERAEPIFDPMAPPPAQLEKKPGLDALIDVLAPIALESVISGEAALAAMPPTRRAGSKPFAVEGLNEATQQWEAPQPGQRYAAFQAGVQLANRTGALNEIEYSEFVMKAQAFADAVNGEPDFPDMLEEVGRARELDQFASAHDAQLSVTLRARTAAWSPGYVQQNAARLGFVPGAIPGRLVLPADAPGAPAVLGLSFDSQAAMADDPSQSALRAVTLSLDVPQVDRSEQPFVRMRDTAIALAASMEGLITDDNGDVIRVEGLDVIGADLEHLYDTLDTRDLAAGSPLARRLFS